MLSRDALDGSTFLTKLGTIYVEIGRREEALACLRQMMAGPCMFSPNDLRIDPLWSRLRDDPRFEQILQSARPL
jgi:hypothetical protein